MNLLLVNDEKLTVDTMNAGIQWDNYGIDSVFVAYSADNAKECISKNQIDIILCDIEMPGENGISLLRWVRENKKGIECVFLTCHANFEYAQEAIALGCQNYLLIPAKYETIGNTVQKVVNQITTQREEKRYREYGKIALKEKVEQLQESGDTQKSNQRPVQDVISYIIENLKSDDLTVNDIAEKHYLHPVYLNRIFKVETGFSIGQFIITERMNLAADMLSAGEINARVVAEQVGYKSYSNFNNAFKKHFGCPPSEYRKPKA